MWFRYVQIPQFEEKLGTTAAMMLQFDLEFVRGVLIKI